MYIGIGSVQVRASISIHDDTAMSCLVDENGDVELQLGGESDAYLFLTEGGANKLVRTLTELSTRAPS